MVSDEHLSSMEWKITKRPGWVKEVRGEGNRRRGIETRKASARGKAERPSLIAKRRFGFAKTRYKGLGETASALTALFAPANMAMWPRAGRPELPAASPAQGGLRTETPQGPVEGSMGRDRAG